MVVMPRESWTDERLDDFRGEVNRRFDGVDRRIEETNQLMDAGFARIDAKFDALQRTLMQIGFVLAAAVLGMFASVLGLIATQL